jgi:hypothetical protein
MKSPRKPFPLRLPVSIHAKAEDTAQSEGISLNQFITIALVEKLTRIEQTGGAGDLTPRDDLDSRPRTSGHNNGHVAVGRQEPRAT